VRLNLFMRGLWEVEVAVESDAVDGSRREYTKCDVDRRKSGSDLITFRACVPDD
jgi:hypothetical protein